MLKITWRIRLVLTMYIYFLEAVEPRCIIEGRQSDDLVAVVTERSARAELIEDPLHQLPAPEKVSESTHSGIVPSCY